MAGDMSERSFTWKNSISLFRSSTADCNAAWIVLFASAVAAVFSAISFDDNFSLGVNNNLFCFSIFYKL